MKLSACIVEFRGFVRPQNKTFPLIDNDGCSVMLKPSRHRLSILPQHDYNELLSSGLVSTNSN